MSYTAINYRDVDPVGDGLHLLRNPLDCENLGVSVIDCDPGWTGKPHDHGDDGQEEVYLLVEGGAEIAVEGEHVALEPGDAVRVDPAATRQILNGDVDSVIVVVGAA